MEEWFKNCTENRRLFLFRNICFPHMTQRNVTLSDGSKIWWDGLTCGDSNVIQGQTQFSQLCLEQQNEQWQTIWSEKAWTTEERKCNPRWNTVVRIEVLKYKVRSVANGGSEKEVYYSQCTNSELEKCMKLLCRAKTPDGEWGPTFSRSRSWQNHTLQSHSQVSFKWGHNRSLAQNINQFPRKKKEGHEGCSVPLYTRLISTGIKISLQLNMSPKNFDSGTMESTTSLTWSSWLG